MQFILTSIPDVILIELKAIGDYRGYFMETFHSSLFAEAGISNHFVQDNHSGSQFGTLRGLHYQIRQAQGKLVRVVVGEIFDVAVDIRRSSPTFGQWVGMKLSAENKRQLWVPPGFAHGFYVLSDWAELIYKATDFYAPEWERSILWSDPLLGIEWPILPDTEPILSEKDQRASLLADADLFE
jgi:dTDP-4-dehydrorhamnose 3,5-epimerase